MKKTFYLIFCFVLISCESFKETQLDFEEIPLNNFSDIISNSQGASLYIQNCQTCHGSLVNSEKLNRDSTAISNAISDIPSMQYLSSLSSAEIDLIAGALSYELPVLSSPSPFGSLNSSTSSVELSIKTNEKAVCKYSLSNVDFSSMSASLVQSSDSRTHVKMISVVAGTSYKFFTRCQDLYGNESANALEINFSIDQSNIPDTTAPLINNFLPENNSSLPSGTSSVTISFATNENATCKFSTSASDNYNQMSPLTGSGNLSHNQVLNNLTSGNSYTYYFLCQDQALNLSIKERLDFSVNVQNLNGNTLYADNCASCHNSLSFSTKLERSAGNIQSAIASIPTMQYLSFLTTEQTMEIARALSFNPPIMSALKPSGNLASSTSSVLLEVTTNEVAYCKVSTSNISYDQMTDQLQSANNFTKHTLSKNVSSGQSYKYYVRCRDAYNNSNSSSEEINFTIVNSNSGDTTPPVIQAGFPFNGYEADAGTTSFTVTAVTNESSSCKYSLNDDSYNQMPYTMNTTGGINHSNSLGGLSDGNTYTLYVLCADDAFNISNKKTSNFSVKSSGAINGTELYANNCAVCHNVLNDSTKKNRTAEQIQNAINNISAMNIPSLISLNSESVSAIAYALDFTSNPGQVNEENLEVRLRVGSRRYTASILNDVFGNIPGSHNNTRQRIFESSIFGGNCDNYSATILGYTSFEFPREYCYGNLPNSVLTPVHSPLRSGWTTYVCERIIYKATDFAHFSSKIGGITSDWSNSKFEMIYDQFYLDETPSSEVVSKFKDLFDSQSNNSDGWRAVTLGVCVSPEWQVIQ